MSDTKSCQGVTGALAVHQRYAADVVRLHAELDFRGLPDHVTGEPLHFRRDERYELTTLTVADDQLPLRYLNGVLGFRLAQYLRLGWMSEQLVYENAMFRDTVDHPDGVQNLHTISLCSRTGRIRGYIGLACTKDPQPLALDAPGRYRFPTENAHDINLASRFAAPGVTTHHAFELKRFVRDAGIPVGKTADAIPWQLLMSLGKSIVVNNDRIKVMLGDAKKHRALRHFRLTGFDVQVETGTSPSLPPTDVMAPIYDQKVVAVPFVAPVPADLDDYMNIIRDSLDEDTGVALMVKELTQLKARRKRQNKEGS
ncbi:hypothetical protein ABZV67_41705 [Streptomyces sp. NPDC005065]|uniref:hypothetical protein n=1 Tax=unclassified Streptomyces TaxID=2593676 RepID=UPI0033BB3D9E